MERDVIALVIRHFCFDISTTVQEVTVDTREHGSHGNGNGTATFTSPTKSTGSGMAVETPSQKAVTTGSLSDFLCARTDSVTIAQLDDGGFTPAVEAGGGDNDNDDGDVSDGDRDAATYDVDAVDGGGSAPVSAATTPVDDHGHDHGHSRSHRRTDSRDGAHTPELDGDDTRAASTTSATDSADVVALQKSLQVGLLAPRLGDTRGVALSAVFTGPSVTTAPCVCAGGEAEESSVDAEVHGTGRGAGCCSTGAEGLQGGVVEGRVTVCTKGLGPNPPR